MTIFDLINNLPNWLQIIAYILLLIFSIKTLLFPFKFDFLNKRVDKMLELQESLIEELRRKNDEAERTNTLLSQVMASLLRREQERNDNKIK